MKTTAYKIPVTIITGFLGSGKTTLIHQIAKNAQGRRLAIIVNEFGELGMDGEILKGGDCGCEEENILELSNGCLCCTVQEEFLPAMLALMERKADIDHIIIETSGLALPKPLVKAFNWPDLKPQITVDAVITVVDAVGQATGQICDREKIQAQRLEDDNLDHEPSIEELFEDQLSCADLIIMTKTDLISQQAYEQVRTIIQKKAGSQVKLIAAVKGNIPVDVLLGLNAKAEDDIDNKHSHHETHHDHDHDHDDAISATVLTVSTPCTPEDLITAMRHLVATFPIYRIKGIIHVPGKPMRMIVQGVAHRFENYYDRKWKENEIKATRLVIIGRHLEKAILAKTLEEKLSVHAAS